MAPKIKPWPRGTCDDCGANLDKEGHYHDCPQLPSWEEVWESADRIHQRRMNAIARKNGRPIPYPEVEE